MVEGKWAVEKNATSTVGRSDYAAHTWRLNTGSIGLTVCAMAGAKSAASPGKYPVTEKQFEAMCAKAAALCKSHGIPVSDTTVLTHAEVQPNLGKTQKGKWDLTVLAYKPELEGHAATGAYVRERVEAHLKKL